MSGRLTVLYHFDPSAETYRRIANVDLHVPTHVSPEAKDMIVRVSTLLLCSRHLFAPSCSQIMNSFSLPTAMCTQLLRKEPENRLPLVEVSRHPWILKYKKKGGSAGGPGA